MRFNPPIKIGRCVAPLQVSALEPCKLINVKLSRLLKAQPWVKPLLDEVELVGGYKFIAYTLKVQGLDKHDYTCLPGWHTDTINDFSSEAASKRPEVHHILVSDLAPTEFIITELELEAKKLKEQLFEIARYEYQYRSIEPWIWHTYTRFNFHRGSQAEHTGKRMMLRVSETDVIAPA